jgi:hypothetical protein
MKHTYAEALNDIADILDMPTGQTPDDIVSAVREMRERMTGFDAIVAKTEAALEFYSDPHNYGIGGGSSAKIYGDGGKLARVALRALPNLPDQPAASVGVRVQRLIRLSGRTTGWHPTWFRPGARCKSSCHGWRGTVKGFEDGPNAEHGVILTDCGRVLSTPITHGVVALHNDQAEGADK